MTSNCLPAGELKPISVSDFLSIRISTILILLLTLERRIILGVARLQVGQCKLRMNNNVGLSLARKFFTSTVEPGSDSLACTILSRAARVGLAVIKQHRVDKSAKNIPLRVIFFNSVSPALLTVRSLNTCLYRPQVNI